MGNDTKQCLEVDIGLGYGRRHERNCMPWSMGVGWQINHRANDAPSVSYLRIQSTVPAIVPSHEQPTVEQVMANVQATFNGVLDVIHSQNCSKLVHTVLMFDKLAM